MSSSVSAGTAKDESKRDITENEPKAVRSSTALNLEAPESNTTISSEVVEPGETNEEIHAVPATGTQSQDGAVPAAPEAPPASAVPAAPATPAVPVAEENATAQPTQRSRTRRGRRLLPVRAERDGGTVNATAPARRLPRLVGAVDHRAFTTFLHFFHLLWYIPTLVLNPLTLLLFSGDGAGCDSQLRIFLLVATFAALIDCPRVPLKLVSSAQARRASQSRGIAARRAVRGNPNGNVGAIAPPALGEAGTPLPMPLPVEQQTLSPAAEPDSIDRLGASAGGFLTASGVGQEPSTSANPIPPAPQTAPDIASSVPGASNVVADGATPNNGENAAIGATAGGQAENIGADAANPPPGPAPALQASQRTGTPFRLVAKTVFRFFNPLWALLWAFNPIWTVVGAVWLSRSTSLVVDQGPGATPLPCWSVTPIIFYLTFFEVLSQFGLLITWVILGWLHVRTVTSANGPGLRSPFSGFDDPRFLVDDPALLLNEDFWAPVDPETMRPVGTGISDEEWDALVAEKYEKRQRFQALRDVEEGLVLDDSSLKDDEGAEAECFESNDEVELMVLDRGTVVALKKDSSVVLEMSAPVDNAFKSNSGNSGATGGDAEWLTATSTSSPALPGTPSNTTAGIGQATNAESDASRQKPKSPKMKRWNGGELVVMREPTAPALREPQVWSPSTSVDGLLVGARPMSASSPPDKSTTGAIEPDGTKLQPTSSAKPLNGLDMFPDDSPTCSICLADYEEGDSLRRLYCGHRFHETFVDGQSECEMDGGESRAGGKAPRPHVIAFYIVLAGVPIAMLALGLFLYFRQKLKKPTYQHQPDSWRGDGRYTPSQRGTLTPREPRPELEFGTPSERTAVPASPAPATPAPETPPPKRTPPSATPQDTVEKTTEIKATSRTASTKSSVERISSSAAEGRWMVVHHAPPPSRSSIQGSIERRSIEQPSTGSSVDVPQKETPL
ncbi:hypothetical protein HDU96_000601 [Phlyctochytrium bullatum]|nr:hypothetical protein HDU96_000601 [Phlyctochytrium bullatum]